MVNIKNRKQIIPKLLFFNSFSPPHFNKKIVTVQYLHSYTLRDVQNSLSICFLVIKNYGADKLLRLPRCICLAAGNYYAAACSHKLLIKLPVSHCHPVYLQPYLSALRTQQHHLSPHSQYHCRLWQRSHRPAIPQACLRWSDSL